jgi:hypothetical protein
MPDPRLSPPVGVFLTNSSTALGREHYLCSTTGWNSYTLSNWTIWGEPRCEHTLCYLLS